MNLRQKKLAAVLGAVAFVLAALFGYQFLFTHPLRALDRKTAQLQDQLYKARAERRAYFNDEEKLKELTARTFSDTVDSASAKSGAMLTREILRSGLSEASFTRLPMGPRKLRGADEIGWNIQGSGPLENIINLLFALQNSPYIHRLDNISVNPGDGQDNVRARFHFLTLVITAPPDVEFKDLEPQADLQSGERRSYDVIVARNLLRPYQEPPAPPPPEPTLPPTTPVAPPDAPPTLRVVSLSEWNGQPEIHVREAGGPSTQLLKPGDSLAGGQIVMVDYRPLPKPGQPGLKSFSRVILKIGDEYWAIDKGQTVAEKYRLSAEQLPPSLAGG